VALVRRHVALVQKTLSFQCFQSEGISPDGHRLAPSSMNVRGCRLFRISQISAAAPLSKKKVPLVDQTAAKARAQRDPGFCSRVT
jgi:hypothetical protein